jgi:hypothetical protein
MPGARCARSLVCEMKKHTSIVTTVTPVSPGIPRAMVLTPSFVLSSAIGRSCRRHRRKYLRQFDASVEASGPHDFTVRKRRIRQRAIRVHRIPSYVRDDREASLLKRRDDSVYRCFYQTVKRNFGKSEIEPRVRTAIGTGSR